MFKSIFEQSVFSKLLQNPNLLKKFTALEVMDGANLQILNERLNSFADTQLKALRVNLEKKELNRLTADYNGITIEQLIASPNYEHLIKEYKMSMLIKLVTDCMNLTNDTLKDLGSEITFSEDEIDQIVSIFKNSISI